MCCSWYWTWQHCLAGSLHTAWVYSGCKAVSAGFLYLCASVFWQSLAAFTDVFVNGLSHWILSAISHPLCLFWISVVFLCISPSFCIYDLSHTYTVAGNGNALHCNLVLLKMNFPSPSPFSVTVLLCHNWLLSSLLYMIFILIEDGHQSDHQQHQQHHHQHYQQNQEDVWDAFCAEDERAPDAKIEKPSVCFEIWILMHETNKFVGHFSQLIPIVCTCFFLVQNNRNNMGQVETQWQPAAATNIQYIKQASNHARKHCRNCQFGCKSLWEEDRAVERL